MSDKTSESQAELIQNALADPMLYSIEVDEYLRKRRIADLLDRVAKQDSIDNSMKAVQPRVSKRLADKTPYQPEDVLFETVSQFSNMPSLAAPEVAKTYENELQQVDIRDLLAILFSSENERPLTLAEAAEKEADLPQGVARFLRQERYAELTHGHALAGPVSKRVDAVRNSELGDRLFTSKEALQAGRYALMAGIIVGTGGAAIPGMVGVRLAKEVIPSISNSLSQVKNQVERWLVENHVITQENLDKANERASNRRKAFMSTKTGKALSIVGCIAATAGAAALANEAVGLDGVFERVSALWEKEPFDEATVDLDVVGPSEVTMDTTALSHPDGGFSSQGLLAATEGIEGEAVEAFKAALADMPEQMSGLDLSNAISQAAPSAGQLSIGTVIAQAGELGLDVNQIREVLSSAQTGDPLEQQRALAGSVLEQSGYAGFVAPNFLSTPAPNMLEVGGASSPAAGFIPPTLDSFTMEESASPDEARPESQSSVDHSDKEVPTHPASIDISIEVSPGDTLSNLIWDQYKAAGITLTAAELYAPSSLADHPGGIVGMIAEQNELADPDMIRPGDKIEFAYGEEAPANESQIEGETPGPNPSKLAHPAEETVPRSEERSIVDSLVEQGIAKLEPTAQPSASTVHDFPALQGYQPQMPQSSDIVEVHDQVASASSEEALGAPVEVASSKIDKAEINLEDEKDQKVQASVDLPQM